MPRIHVRQISIKRLWEHCSDGLFAVPEIQREFVWDSKRAYRLLDSINRELPIGSLLVWEAKSDHRHLLRHAQHILPAHNARNKKIWFLIDGQQRLSVLYRAKEGHTVENSNGRTLDFSTLCYSFDSRYDTKFVFMKRPAEGLHIPVPDILAHDWTRRLRYLSEGKKAKLARFREVLRTYDVPVMFIKTTKLDEIREAFLRINSGGLRISTADRAFTRASRLNLRRLVNELRGGLPHGFGSVAPEIFQSAMALIVGQRELGSDAVESAIKKLEREEIENGKVSKKFARRWRAIDESIKKAVDYLITELGVVNASYIPSDNMLTLLSFFFHCNNRRQPTSKQRREIRKWFWATGVARRYTGRGYFQNIKADIEFFEQLGRKGSATFRFKELVYKDDVRHADYQVRGGLASAFFVLLIQKQPLYLANGARIPIDKAAAIGNRKDKHHIFPKTKLYGQGFPRREVNSLCNICYLVAEENQSLGGNRPEDYLAPYKKRKHFSQVMRSHLIPYNIGSGLWEKNVKRGYKTFQRIRMETITKEFEKAAGIKLFRNG